VDKPGGTGRFGEALADFSRAIELDPANARVIAARGDVHRLMGRYDEALADLSRSIELDLGRAWALAHRGEAAERPAATPDHVGEVIALRASDGRQLWQRPWTPADDGPNGPQIVGVDAATVLFLPPTANPRPALPVAQLISVTRGLLLASVSISSYGSHDPWRSWPALLGRSHAIVVAQGSGPAFTLTTADGYPSSTDPGLGGGPAAVARNVAYFFLSAGSCPPDTPGVTAVDLRTGRSLWTLLVPQIPCTDLSQAASLLAYDNGFAVRTSDGRLLLYQ